MSIVYDKASEEIHESIKQCMLKFHPHLIECEATIECLVVSREGAKGEKIGGQVLKERGHARAAKVKINSLGDRTEGKCDATIILDSHIFMEMAPDGKSAVIDHQLEHLGVMREDEEGNVLRDKWGRPRLKMIRHDHEFGWFEGTAKRYADASPEIQQAKAFFEKNGQGWFGFLPFGTGRPPESLAEEAARIADKPEVAKADAPAAPKAKRGRPKKGEPAADPSVEARKRLDQAINKRFRDAQIIGSDEKAVAVIAQVSGMTVAGVDEFAAELRTKSPADIDGFTAAIEEMPVATLVNIVRSSGVEAA